MHIIQGRINTIDMKLVTLYLPTANSFCIYIIRSHPLNAQHLVNHYAFDHVFNCINLKKHCYYRDLKLFVHLIVYGIYLIFRVFK